MLDVLKSFLMREQNGKIFMNSGLSCSLEELHKALQSIVGKDAADMFLQDVYREIDKLSEKLTHRGEIISS